MWKSAILHVAGGSCVGPGSGAEPVLLFTATMAVMGMLSSNREVAGWPMRAKVMRVEAQLL